MNPKEIILSNEPENRIKNNINEPDSSFARLAIPKKFISPSFGYNNLYQSSINIRTNADTVGQDIIDKIYVINKVEWTLENYSPPEFTLREDHTSARNMAGRIKAFEVKALSVSDDGMFKIIVTARPLYNKQLIVTSSTPESLIYIPHEAEQESNVYIQCPYQYKKMLCRIRDKIDQKIIVESLIDRRQLVDWKILREATRKFVMQHYVNP